MKILIDIPEEWFCRLQNEWGWALAENAREAIKSGTILPKGHGRLIDADALFEEYEKTGWFNNADRDEVAEKILIDAPTIIEAEQEEPT